MFGDSALDTSSIGVIMQGRVTRMSKPDHEDNSLVGTYRRFGEDGPVYQVLVIKSNDKAEVEFPESGDRIDLAVDSVRRDPVAI
jgi:hypothetical protein